MSCHNKGKVTNRKKNQKKNFIDCSVPGSWRQWQSFYDWPNIHLCRLHLFMKRKSNSSWCARWCQNGKLTIKKIKLKDWTIYIEMIGGNRQISVYFILHPFTLHYTNFMSGCVCGRHCHWREKTRHQWQPHTLIGFKFMEWRMWNHLSLSLFNIRW